MVYTLQNVSVGYIFYLYTMCNHTYTCTHTLEHEMEKKVIFAYHIKVSIHNAKNGQ